MTDAGLKALAAHKSLRLLYVGSTQITNVGLKDPAELKNLAVLGVKNTKVTDAGLRELKKSLPRLTVRE